MKVSLSWLGIFFLTLILVIFTYKGFCILNDCDSIEGFLSSTDTQGIQLKSCPTLKGDGMPGLEQMIDGNGNTICKNVETNGPVCTLSHKSSDLPTCDQYLLSYFRSKATSMCPASMPNYFERVNEKGVRVRGCFAGMYNEKGTAPAVNSPSCNIYDKKQDDELKMDSCSNIRMLDETQCLPGTGIVSKKRLTRWRDDMPPAVFCEFQNPSTGMASSCHEDTTTFKQHEYAAKVGILPPNWKETYEYYNKISWCQKKKMVEIDKSISFDDLRYVSIVPNSGGPVYPALSLDRVKNSRLQNKGSKFCLDVGAAGMQNGAPLVLWDCHDGGNQKFTFDSKERLVASHSGKCLDLDGPSGKVQQYTCLDGANQKWYTDSQGRIRSRVNNQCLKTVGAKLSQAIVTFCGDGDDQKFLNV